MRDITGKNIALDLGNIDDRERCELHNVELVITGCGQQICPTCENLDADIEKEFYNE